MFCGDCMFDCVTLIVLFVSLCWLSFCVVEVCLCITFDWCLRLHVGCLLVCLICLCCCLLIDVVWVCWCLDCFVCCFVLCCDVLFCFELACGLLCCVSAFDLFWMFGFDINRIWLLCFSVVVCWVSFYWSV